MRTFLNKEFPYFQNKSKKHINNQHVKKQNCELTSLPQWHPGKDYGKPINPEPGRDVIQKKRSCTGTKVCTYQSSIVLLIPNICPFWYATILFGLQKVRQKSAQICDKNCLVTKQRKFLVGVLGILVGVLSSFVFCVLYSLNKHL